MFDNLTTTWIRKWGGVCQGANPEDVPPGMFHNALDMETDRLGYLVPRKGFEPISEATPDEEDIQSVYIADWDGVDRVFVSTAKNVYEWDRDTGDFALIYEIEDEDGGRMLFTTLNEATSPILIFGNGAIPLQKWTGTGTSTDCSGAPVGRPVAYKNYLAIFGISGKPGRVQFSTLPGDPDSWTSGGVEIFLELRGTVTSVFPFSGLVIFTTTRTALFSGDPDEPSTVQTLSESDGCVCHETVANVGGALFWLSQSGVLAWDGGGSFPARNISDPQEDGTFSSIRVDMGKLDWDEVAGASAIYDPVSRRYILSAQLQASLEGAEYWRTWVYDVKSSGWWPWSVRCSTLAVYRYLPKFQPSVLASLGTCLRHQKNTSYADVDIEEASTTYSYSASSGFWDAGSPDTAKLWRGLTVNASAGFQDNYGGNRTIKFHIRGEFGKMFGADATVNTITGGFILDVNVLGDSLFETNYNEAMTRIALRSKHFQFVVFGSGTTNAAAIASLGISYRLHSQRPILVK